MELNDSLKWSFDVILEETPSTIENINNSYLLFRFISFNLTCSFYTFIIRLAAFEAVAIKLPGPLQQRKDRIILKSGSSSRFTLTEGLNLILFVFYFFQIHAERCFRMVR